MDTPYKSYRHEHCHARCDRDTAYDDDLDEAGSAGFVCGGRLMGMMFFARLRPIFSFVVVS